MRHRFKIIASIVILAVLAAAWTYGWLRARDFALLHFDIWLSAETKAGRAHECNNRRFGGYPFYIAISCETPVFQLSDKSGEAVVRFSNMKIFAPAYAPTRLVAELGSPFTFIQNGKLMLSATFKSARLSLRHSWNIIERVSLAGDEVAIDLPEGKGSMSAKHAELYLQPSSPATGPQLQDFNFAIEAKGMLTPGALPDQPMDLMLDGIVRNWPGWRGAPKPSLDGWRESDGKVEVKDLRIKRNGGTFFVTGETYFNDTHRAEGRFEAVFVNSPDLLRGLIMQGENDAGAMFGPLLLMLGKQVEFEGQRATSMQLKVNNGVLTLGTMVLGEFPPLY